MRNQSLAKMLNNSIAGAIWGTSIISATSALLFIFSRDFRFFLEGNKAYSYDVYSRTWILAYHGIYQIWWWGFLVGTVSGMTYLFFTNSSLTQLTWQTLFKIWLRFAPTFIVVFSFLGLVSGALWLGVGIGLAWGISISMLTSIFWSVVFASIYSRLPNRFIRVSVGTVVGFFMGFITSTMIRYEFTLTLVLLSGYLGAISSAIILIFFPQLYKFEHEST